MKTKICRRIIRRLCHESGSYHLTVLYQNNIEIERKVSDRFVAFVILLHKYQLNERPFREQHKLLSLAEQKQLLQMQWKRTFSGNERKKK